MTRYSVSGPHWANSLASGKFEWNFRYVIFKWILVVDGWGISCEIALILMSLDFTEDQSTLLQVMSWCRQATSHYLNQCWPRSLSPDNTTRAWRKTKHHMNTDNQWKMYTVDCTHLPPKCFRHHSNYNIVTKLMQKRTWHENLKKKNNES